LSTVASLRRTRQHTRTRREFFYGAITRGKDEIRRFRFGKYGLRHAQRRRRARRRRQRRTLYLRPFSQRRERSPRTTRRVRRRDRRAIGRLVARHETPRRAPLARRPHRQ